MVNTILKKICYNNYYYYLYFLITLSFEWTDWCMQFNTWKTTCPLPFCFKGTLIWTINRQWDQVVQDMYRVPRAVLPVATTPSHLCPTNQLLVCYDRQVRVRCSLKSLSHLYLSFFLFLDGRDIFPSDYSKEEVPWGGGALREPTLKRGQVRAWKLPPPTELGSVLSCSIYQSCALYLHFMQTTKYSSHHLECWWQAQKTNF